MNYNHTKISINFQFDDIMLTHVSSDLPTRRHMAGSQGQETKFGAATSTSVVAQME